MRYGQRLFTGIVGLLLVLLVVVAPGYIVSKAHDLETGGKNVLSFSEVIAGAGTGEISYTPYMEANADTVVTFRDGAVTDYHHIYYQTGWHAGSGISFNYDDYRDLWEAPGISPNLAYIRLMFWGDAQTMIDDNVNTFFWNISCSDGYGIMDLYWVRLSGDLGNSRSSLSDDPFTGTASMKGGGTYYTDSFTISENDLNAGITYQFGYDDDHIGLMVQLQISNYDMADTLTTDFQLSPEYYEVSGGGSSSSIGNTTHYVPIDYKIGYYDIRSISLLVGGVMIFITALCSTTLINPSNILKGKKRLI